MRPLRAEKEHAAQPPVGAGAPLALSQATPTDTPGSRHSRKFRAAIAVLVLAGIASLVAAVALTSASRSNDHAGGGSWSDWQPSTSGASGAQEIADFLSPYYRASSAYQLAVVTTVNLNDPSNPLEVVIPTSGTSSGFQALNPKTTIAYNLCGIGTKDCSIGVGTPSSNRLLLLRREALELALYSFKYLSDVQTVVAILPPGRSLTSNRLSAKPPTAGQSSSPTKTLNLALAFDRKELEPFLNRPLRTTLPESLPPTVTQMQSAPESELVSVVTAHGLFQERTEQAQDGSNLVVLSPLPPQ
jgi:hypothetical protein